MTNGEPRHDDGAGRPPLLQAIVLLLPLGILAAVIGNELVLMLGVVAHPGMAGVLAGMVLARVPGAFFRPFAAPRMQAFAQATAAAASIGAGQALLLPIGIPFVVGRADLVGPMLLGAVLALLVDGWLMWRLFGSTAFPAEAAWPQGAAAAATIRAAREGDRPGTLVLLGMVTGVVGAAYRAPMAAFGVALLGNPWALGIFAAGVLLRAYGAPVLGWLGPGGDLMQAQVPQGMLAGAVIVAVVQLLRLGARGGIPRSVLVRASVAHVAIAGLLALGGGLHAAMPAGMLALFIAFAAAAALLHALAVGLVAMQSGWLPSLAAAAVVLAVGMLIGFPPSALCLLVGYAAATGPGLATMGQALKVVHALDGGPSALRQQAWVVMLAFLVAAVVVWLGHGAYFAADRVPPAGRVFAVAISAGVRPEAAAKLALWALAGALLQWAGGVRRQLGVMLAAGLLLLGPAIGWAVLAGLALRALLLRRGDRYRDGMESFGAGVIAGDALYVLYDSLGRAFAAPPAPTGPG